MCHHLACACAPADEEGRSGACANLFSHVVVDEAGQASEPEVLCAITHTLARGAATAGAAGAGGPRLLLAGDPRQLGPVIASPLALKHGLGLSLVERLTSPKGALRRLCRCIIGCVMTSHGCGGRGEPNEGVPRFLLRSCCGGFRRSARAKLHRGRRRRPPPAAERRHG